MITTLGATSFKHRSLMQWVPSSSSEGWQNPLPAGSERFLRAVAVTMGLALSPPFCSSWVRRLIFQRLAGKATGLASDTFLQSYQTWGRCCIVVGVSFLPFSPVMESRYASAIGYFSLHRHYPHLQHLSWAHLFRSKAPFASKVPWKGVLKRMLLFLWICNIFILLQMYC